MKNFIYTLPFFVLTLGITSEPVHAQYLGGYEPEKKEAPKDLAERPVSRLFSPHISDQVVGQKLDILYNNLKASLLIYAASDLNYQASLYEVLKPERFQTTRYSAEFKDELNEAMKSLNENYKRMNNDLEKADKQVKELKSTLGMIAQEEVSKLWEINITHLKETKENYFKLQGGFLKKYHQLSTFLLKKNGGFFYNSQSQGLSFYNNGDYQYYGKSLDYLRQTTHKQKALLKKNAPANPKQHIE